MSNAISLNKGNFDSEVLQASVPVLVDFWASWCGPCKMLAPTIDQLATENPDIKVFKVDIDAEPELAARYGVMSIPTLAVFKQGKLTESAVGVRPKASILQMINK